MWSALKAFETFPHFYGRNRYAKNMLIKPLVEDRGSQPGRIGLFAHTTRRAQGIECSGSGELIDRLYNLLSQKASVEARFDGDFFLLNQNINHIF